MSALEPTVSPVAQTEQVVESESLVEEVSIDGMCGVY
ncbi:mycofactocin precursor MftA [Microbacterium murale]|nr:mycofactocin precursor MftA [Microbacterium murale]